MNGKKFLYCGISAAAILTIAGCSVPTITANYTMPPEAISDVKGIDTMEIVVNVSLPNSSDAADSAIARAAICERLAAGFGREGFFRTTDPVWGNPAGADALASLVKSKNSRHGYARLVTPPVTPRARIELNFKADVTSGERNQIVDTKLTKVFYRVAYRKQEITWGSGERKNRETIQIPYSVPDRSEKSVARSKIKQYWINARGALEAKVIDKNGKVVYQKRFDNLSVAAQCDHSSLKAVPTKASVFSALSKDAIAAIVKDLSPHKESKQIKINKDGDKRGFYLLQALAFSEAVSTFENIDEKKRTFADWENLGVTYEVLGAYEDAQKCYETALKVKKEDKGMFDYDKKIAEDGLVRIKAVIAAREKLDKIK